MLLFAFAARPRNVVAAHKEVSNEKVVGSKAEGSPSPLDAAMSADVAAFFIVVMTLLLIGQHLAYQ